MSSKVGNLKISFFNIQVKNKRRTGYIYAPSSISCPHSNTVMFITQKYLNRWKDLLEIKDCLIFWPNTATVPEIINDIHFVELCKNPRLEYAKFFRDNGIYNQTLEQNNVVDLERFKKKNIMIMPNVYIGENVLLGDNVYIGSGARLIGQVSIGNNVIIRENSVIGADGLAFERDEDGNIITIPQFGGVVIEDNVNIGANVVIARGAIDDTVIHKGCIIDNSCFISHNVILEENVAIVGETILFGSSHIGRNSFISGNTAVRDGREIGEEAFIGMGSIVTKDVEKGHTVCGNPARSIIKG